MHDLPHNQDILPPEVRSPIFRIWTQADRQVPFPFLCRWRFHPPTGQTAATLHHLTEAEFVYRMSNLFVAELRYAAGEFAPATLLPSPLDYRLLPMQGCQGLISPETAEEILQRHLEQQSADFWSRVWADEAAAGMTAACVERFRQLHWISVALDQPNRSPHAQNPGLSIVEPQYRFLKHDFPLELLVGARTGQITVRAATP
jgi:hypothetical protein